jgi:hypothetical protein
MGIKTSTATLLLVSVALLTGCNIRFGPNTRSMQVTGDKSETTAEQQDTESQKTQARLAEDLRLANERARLAEEKAELEKQKREFAEERLKQLNKNDKGGGDKESSGDEAEGES